MPMCSAWDNAALPALGFPIRESADHRLFNAYPRLIAVVHALHRLLVPRHPPGALPILTVIESNLNLIRCYPLLLQQCHWLLCSSQGPRGAEPAIGTSLGAVSGPVSHSPAACIPRIRVMQTPRSQVRSTFPGRPREAGQAPFGAP